MIGSATGFHSFIESINVWHSGYHVRKTCIEFEAIQSYRWVRDGRLDEVVEIVQLNQVALIAWLVHVSLLSGDTYTVRLTNQ